MTVVLPAPFGPSRPNASPGSIAIVRASTAVSLPYFRVSADVSITFILGLAQGDCVSLVCKRLCEPNGLRGLFATASRRQRSIGTVIGLTTQPVIASTNLQCYTQPPS